MNRPDPPGERGSDPPDDCVTKTENDAQLYISAVDDDDSRSHQSVSYDDDDGGGKLVEKNVTADDPPNPMNDLGQEPCSGGAEPLQTSMEDEGEEPASDPTVEFEPDCMKTEAISFHVLCTRLEKMWQQRHRKTNRQSKDDVFSLLIDDSLRNYLSDSSWFPLFRVVLPDMDTSRPHTGMKERTIALAWGEAFDLTPGSRPFERLLQYQDPSYFGRSDKYAVSDLSVAVQEIVEPRDGMQGSQLNLKQINDLLDELVALKGGPMRPSNHDWRESTTATRAKVPLLKQRRRDWVRTLRDKKLSALEHKWVVRILLQKLEIGFSSKSVLSRWIPGGLAIELYRMNNNLKSICTTLANPHWRRRREEKEREKQTKTGKMAWMERPKGEAILGNTIAPMLALKVYFRDAMAELCRGHRAFSKQVGINLLPLKNPAILCEVKLDGERMVVHVRRGIVTMQTRRGRWYSDLYSPVLAPSIRRAIAKWDVDVIFDGEVIAWDNGKQETIPFGNNRTIALARQRWMESQGLVDSRDRNLHEGQTDLNVMKPAYVDGDVVESIAGSDCWLRYEVFDILYVGGPQAADLISRAALLPADEVKIGSTIHLNGFQRKRILHELVTPQEKEIVLVPALVVRPNGAAVLAEDYFSATSPTEEKGYQASIVDSIEWGLDASVEEKEVYDHMRGRLSDSEIGIRRAESTDRFYSDIVDNRGLEGVLLKDLNACYLLEGRKYWCKHKPDYEENSELGDIDLIILGAYHGTGMGPSGKLNGFLCGCVDDDNPDTYIAVVKVNGGGVSRDISDQMLAVTGYKKQTDTEPWDTGQWFRGDYQGKIIPDFVSRRSFQQSEGRPPVFERKKYPDLWIHPDDSIVLTLKAGEIVATDGFQAGITLRFPRIERVRMKDSADDKDAQHVETLAGLHRAYREQMQRREGSGEIEFQSGSVTSGKATRRFQTAEEGLRKKPVRRNVSDRGPEWTMPTADRKESSALNGLTIVALEGIYDFDESSLDAEEAKQQGWFDFAKNIRDRDDLLLFISKHGGTPKISVSQDTDFVVGGRSDDSRVVMHQHGLENAIKERRKRRTGLTSEHMIKIGSVLKWTYLVAMVHLWKKDIKSFKVEDGQDAASLLRCSCIKSTHPQLLEPPRHQFLVSEKRSNAGADDVFGISTAEMCTLIDFKRGLQEVADEVQREGAKKSRQCPDPPPSIPWQYYTNTASDSEMSRCLGGLHAKFWPFNEDGTSTAAIVIYPDIFNSDFGVRERSIDLDEVKSGEVQNRWKQIAADEGPVSSCLPLARAMGAQVTPHLHDGVTHVLCELAKDLVLWNERRDACFTHVERAREICARLGAMHKGQGKVVFVSPDWIRRQWQKV